MTATVTIGSAVRTRDETIANSLIDSKPFTAIKARIRTRSSQGKGRSASLMMLKRNSCRQFAFPASMGQKSG